MQRAVKKEKSASADVDEDRSSDPTVGVGSITASSHYNELVGMFSGKSQIPCVGISFGVNRIFSITKARMEKENTKAVRSNEVDVPVMAFGGGGFTGLLKERMEVAKQLWDAGIKTEFSWKVKPKLPQQFKAAEAGGVPLGVILGEDELAEGKVKLKQMGLSEDNPEREGVIVSREGLVAEVRKRLTKLADGLDEAAQIVAELKLQGKGDVPRDASREISMRVKLYSSKGYTGGQQTSPRCKFGCSTNG